jgi:hypothetical protein
MWCAMLATPCSSPCASDGVDTRMRCTHHDGRRRPRLWRPLPPRRVSWWCR